MAAPTVLMKGGGDIHGYFMISRGQAVEIAEICAILYIYEKLFYR